MSEKPISPLRARMIEDMTVRNRVASRRSHQQRTCPRPHMFRKRPVLLRVTRAKSALTDVG